MADELTLNETDRKKLDGIVQQMTANKEADADIQFVVNDFKTKYGQKKSLNEPTSGSVEVSKTVSTPQSVPSTVSGTRVDGSGAENKARYDKYKEDKSVENPKIRYGKPILQIFPNQTDREIVYGIDDRMSQPITLGDDSRQMGVAKGDVFGEIKVNAENAQKALEGINQSRYVRTKKLQEQSS